MSDSSKYTLVCNFNRLMFVEFLFLQRLLEKKVIFITGTDEHGEKIATAAAANGSSPNEHCDVVSQAYKALWKDVYFSTSANSFVFTLKYSIWNVLF